MTDHHTHPNKLILTKSTPIVLMYASWNVSSCGGDNKGGAACPPPTPARAYRKPHQQRAFPHAAVSNYHQLEQVVVVPAGRHATSRFVMEPTGDVEKEAVAAAAALLQLAEAAPPLPRRRSKRLRVEEECEPGSAWVRLPLYLRRSRPDRRLLDSLLGPDWPVRLHGVAVDGAPVNSAPQVDMSGRRTPGPWFLSRFPFEHLVAMVHTVWSRPRRTPAELRLALRDMNVVVTRWARGGASCHDVLPRLAHDLAELFILPHPGEEFRLAIPGYFTLALSRSHFRCKYEVKAFWVYCLLGVDQRVVPPAWRFMESKLTLAAALEILGAALDRFPRLFAVPWFKPGALSRSPPSRRAAAAAAPQ